MCKIGLRAGVEWLDVEACWDPEDVKSDNQSPAPLVAVAAAAPTPSPTPSAASPGASSAAALPSSVAPDQKEEEGRAMQSMEHNPIEELVVEATTRFECCLI